MNISNNLIEGRKEERNFPEACADAKFPLLFNSFYVVNVRKL